VPSGFGPGMIGGSTGGTDDIGSGSGGPTQTITNGTENTFTITGGTATKLRIAFSNVTNTSGGNARFRYRCYHNGAEFGSGTYSVPLSGKTFNHARCAGGAVFNEIRIRDAEGDQSAEVSVEIVDGTGTIASGSNSSSASAGTSGSAAQSGTNSGSPEKIGTFVYDGK